MRSTTYAIDQGNSFTKAAIFQGDALINHLRVAIGQEEELLLWLHKHECAGGIVSSVRADEGQSIWAELDTHALRMTSDLDMPFAIAYTTPHTLGVDRLANAAGALIGGHHSNNLIIDCGSCITVTLIENGVLKGGSISPGLQMRFNALAHFTGKLPLVKPSPKDIELTGMSTEDSILSGVQRGIVAEIQEIIDVYCRKIAPLHVIVTGGDASYFVQRLKSPIFAEPFLTLMGLHEIFQFQFKQS